MRILQRLVSLLVFILGVLSKSVRGDENDEHVLSNGENIVQFVVHNIEDYDVTVFAKSYCPYCQRTRHLLQELHKEFEGWTLKIIDIDTFDDPQDGPLIQSLLLDLTKQRTVPNIFIGGEHLGGNDDLQSMFHAGDLIPALEELAGLSQSDEV